MLSAEKGESKIAEELLILGTASLESTATNLRRVEGPFQVCFACMRYVAVLFIVVASLFFGSFSNSAQAHGIHPADLAQATERSAAADITNTQESLEQATDDIISVCGANCCSMSGCGFVAQILAEFGFPAISVGKRQLFKSLPWVGNPLNALKRPPRA